MSYTKRYIPNLFLLTILASGYLIYQDNLSQKGVSEQSAKISDRQDSDTNTPIAKAKDKDIDRGENFIAQNTIAYKENQESSDDKIIEEENLFYAKVMMQAERLSEYYQNHDATDELLKIEAINDALSSYFPKRDREDSSDIQVLPSKDQAYLYRSESHPKKVQTSKIIRVASNNKEYTPAIIASEVVYEDRSEKELADSKNKEQKVEQTSLYEGYITGSAIPNNEDNQTVSSQRKIANNRTVLYINNSGFSLLDAKEEEHECSRNNEDVMICKKSITRCTPEENIGLVCIRSYYSQGIWYEENVPLTVHSNSDWIREHLRKNTSFATTKFSDYFAQRYLEFGLIRPDLNATNSLKLLQHKKYLQEKTYLDVGIESLMYHKESLIAQSIFLKGTQFGTGSQSIEGGQNVFFEALKEFLGTLSYTDDSNIYTVRDYWNIMDMNQNRGDNEDFALTAMEWLLLNGVDPQYITLTELRDEIVDSREIVLVLETKNPSEVWVVRNNEVLPASEIYPEGYESFIINEYRYKESNTTK